jgi:flagellar motor switch protein FliM
VVQYGCETWSLTLREEQRLSEFENRVMRRISEPNTDEVTEGWRKLHNEELVLSAKYNWNGRVN